MTKRISFAMLKAAALQQLAAIVPELSAHRTHPGAGALAIILAISRCHLSIEQCPNSVSVVLQVDPIPRHDRAATSLLTMIKTAIEGPLRTRRDVPTCEIGDWLDQAGWIDIVTELLESGATRDAINELADTVALAIKTIWARYEWLKKVHFNTVLQRDLPCYPETHISLTPPALWALAPDASDDPARPTIIERRRQALETYGAIVSVLFENLVTEAIDQARPLNPLLCDRLKIEPAHLRRLRGARALTATLKDYSDYASAVRELSAHSVPLAEWPTRDAWADSRWLKAHSYSLFRIDYVGEQPEPRDAINALTDDILQPIAAERARALGFTKARMHTSFQRGFWPPQTLSEPDRCKFLTALRFAIIGSRGLKSFHEAVTRWHRRAASLAAMRHEQTAETPGWKALCPIWNASDGIHRLIPLTSAAELVAEGNALQHCVGGYYQECRRGDTQILSLRAADDHAATLELILSGDPGTTLSIRAGQFRTFGDKRPPEDLHDIVRTFLDDIKTGKHPVARAEIAAYRKKMRREYDHAWQSGPLSMDHARNAWPLYRALLPRGAPEDFDSWCESSGLNSAFDQMITAIATADVHRTSDVIPL